MPQVCSKSDRYKSLGYLSPNLKMIFRGSIFEVHVAASCVVDILKGSNGLESTLIQEARLFHREHPKQRQR
jgi:hypothetical protein